MKNKEESQMVVGNKAIFSRAWRSATAVALLALGLAAVAAAATSNVAATRHNLSKNGSFSVKATSEDQICVFCHTPHGANLSAPGPLWNRSVNASASYYTRYTSSSLDAETITNGFSDQPGGSSLLCLSCHDGTIALGSVNVLRGKTGVDAEISMTGVDADKGMPSGAYGETTGYTRRLGKDLSNDHPISISYTDDLAAADGEMARLGTVSAGQRDADSGGAVIGVRRPGYKPLLPLAPTGAEVVVSEGPPAVRTKLGQVQCGTCHDPHLTAEKFLRLNRMQVGTPTGTNFSASNDIICLACHTKLGNTWAQSSHANPAVGDETYLSGAAKLRDMSGTPAVWQVACLNCHDTHTASGSRRLLREGVGGTWSTTTIDGQTIRYQPGTTTRPLENTAAIENTCYQCHSSATILNANTGMVPDIQSEFARPRHMPLTSADQGSDADRGKERHDITNADFMESPTKLGLGTPSNRHVECTDCHNTHRVRRGSKFYETPSAGGEGAKRTHNVGGVEGNVASGALRGAWGLQPNFNAMDATWPQNPSSFDEKKGDPGSATSTARTETYLTREYQLCFKCHSNYSNSDIPGNFPTLGNSLGGTPSLTNGMTVYTNVAAEFGSVAATDPPTTGTDQGEESNTTGTGGPCGGDCNPTPSGWTDGSNNHRSWHPVMWPTGRTRSERGSSTWNNLRAPYALADVGILTMQCSDCHGSSQSWTQGTGLSDTAGGPDNTKTQGPHGSDNNFVLKGIWNDTVTPNAAAGSNTAGTLCGRCHDPKNAKSGFAGSASEASHGWSPKAGRYCMFCHVAVPHGWKNKAFLVNLNCVQSEAGGSYTGTCSAIGGNNATTEVTLAPYYYRAKLRISSWARSGNWQESNCGYGKDWMSSACGY